MFHSGALLATLRQACGRARGIAAVLAAAMLLIQAQVALAGASQLLLLGRTLVLSFAAVMLHQHHQHLQACRQTSLRSPDQHKHRPRHAARSSPDAAAASDAPAAASNSASVSGAVQVGAWSSSGGRCTPRAPLPGTAPAYRTCRSTCRPISSNSWTPPQLSNTSSGCTAADSSSAPGSGSSAGSGPSSSRSSGSGSAHSSRATAGAGGSGRSSCKGSGDHDDSDEGGDGNRRFFRLAKSHSLDGPDPAGPATPGLQESEQPHAEAPSSFRGATTPLPEPAGAGAGAAEEVAEAAAVPAAAVTGPWRLASPFAALAPFDGDSSSQGPGSDASASQPASQPVLTPQQPAALQQGEAGAASAGPAAGPPVVSDAAAAADTAAAAAPPPVTGPWKLASPFAALMPAFSAEAGREPEHAATAEAANSKAASTSNSTSTASSQETAQPSPATTTPKQAEATPSASASPSRWPRHPKQPSAAAGAAAAAAGKTGLAALDARIAAAGHMLHNSGPGSRSKHSDKAARQARRLHKKESQLQQAAAATTGPWALHSPFAAAAAGFDLQPDTAAPLAGSSSSSSSRASSIGSGSVDSAKVNAALKPPLAPPPRQPFDPFGSPVPVAAPEDAPAETQRQPEVPAKAAPKPAAPGLEPSLPAAAATANAAAEPAAARTGPWQLFSPFAGFAAPASGSAASSQADLQQLEQAPPAAAAAPAASSPAQAGPAHPGAWRQRRRSSAAYGAGDALGCPSSASPLSSIHPASEPRFSVPLSLPSGLSGSGATLPGSAGNLVMQELSDLELQPTSAASWLAGCDECLSPVPSGMEVLFAAPAGTAVADVDSAAQAPAAQPARLQLPAGEPSLAPHELSSFRQPAAAGPERRQLEQQRVGLVLHDSVTSHMLQGRLPKAAAGQAAHASPAPSAPASPTARVLGPVLPGAAPAAAAPAPANAALAAAAAAAAAVQAGSVPGVAAVSYMPVPAAAPVAAAPAGQPSVVVGVPAAGCADVPQPGSPAAAVAAATAVLQSAATRAAGISCLCCYPPCVSEALPTEVHLHVLGLEQAAAHAAATGVLHTFRVVAFHGSTPVAETRGLLPTSEGMFRVSLPALPKGVLQLALLVDDLHLSFVQPLLVLPAPCAQEVVLLWARLLQSRLSAAAASPRSADPGFSGNDPCGSLDASSADSAWTSEGSTRSSCSAHSHACATPEAPADNKPTPAGSTGSGQQAQVQAAAAVAGASAGSRAAADPCRPAASTTGQPAARISHAEVQGVWSKQFMPVACDIAYLLAANLDKGSAAAAGSAGASGGSAAAGLQVNSESAEFKTLVTQLVQFLAAHGMWAVLQLITDHVYGVGASAKALYTAKAASSTSAAATPTGRTSSSGLAGSAAASAASSAAAAAVDAARHSASVGGSRASASSARTDSSASTATLPASEAVAAAIAVAQAGEELELGPVLLLAATCLQAVARRWAAKGAASCLQACQAAMQEPRAAGWRLFGLLAGAMLVLSWLVGLPFSSS